MSTVIFKASSKIGKALVVITSAGSGDSEQLSNVSQVALVGQTLVISKVLDDGTYWTSTYPEASVMLDISGTTGE
jgi:hypothetical protein